MIFVDSGAWIAPSDKSDQYHQQAKAVYARLKRERARLLTTDYVIDESVTRLRYDSGHAQAVRFLDIMETTERTGVLRVAWTTPTVFQAAASLFRQHDTPVLSFTDCVNFVVCAQFRVTEAFAFDQHFPMRGLILCAP
jgi:predicted nucleic acid-binding protein